MPDKQPVVFTFHKIREQCEQKDAEAWRAFLIFYGPLWLRLLAMYGPGGGVGAGDSSAGQTDAHARVFETLLGTLAENDFQSFRATARQSEREFLVDVRALLLDTASHSLAKANDEGSLGLDGLRKLMEELPLMHQEMLFFKLAGYTDATIERMLRVAPSVAAKAFERLPAEWSVGQPIEQDRCPRPAEWLTVLHESRATKQEKCPERHQLLRIQDGQVSWYDKEPMEKHVANCSACLETWTSLCEVTYWRHVAQPLSTTQVERFLQALPIAAPKKSFFARVFGGSDG